jgi:uncharacterized protein (DUF433 family)
MPPSQVGDGVAIEACKRQRPLMKLSEIIVVDPELMSGTPCFAGTRVPVQALLDYLEGGDSLEDFLEGFPTVKREQAVAFIQRGGELLVGAALSAV